MRNWIEIILDCFHYLPKNENCDNQGKEDEISANIRRPETKARTGILQLVADRTPRKFELCFNVFNVSNDWNKTQRKVEPFQCLSLAHSS